MIVLPAEVLTPKGWKNINEINIKDTICIYDPKTNNFLYENPIQIFHQPLMFSCNSIETPTVQFILDESHDKMYLETQACIKDMFLCRKAKESVESAFESKDLYSPFKTGSFETFDYKEACKLQLDCIFAGYRCNLHCSLTKFECKIVDNNDVVTISPTTFINPTMAVNICTTTGHYLIRVCEQNGLESCVYSSFII